MDLQPPRPDRLLKKMKMANRPLLFLLFAGFAASPAVTADPLLEGRVARLERIQESQGGANLQLQIQQLQQEMQELRGIVERLQYSSRAPQDRYSGRIGGPRPEGTEPPPLLPPGADLSEIRPADQETVHRQHIYLSQRQKNKRRHDK